MNRKARRLACIALTAVVVTAACGPRALGVSPSEQPAAQTGAAVASRPALENKTLPSRPDASATTETMGPWLRPLAALGLVVGIILILRYVLGRWGKAMPAGSAGPVEVVSRTPLPPRGQLLLVRLGRRLVLVGAWNGGATALSEVTDPREVAELLAAAGKRPPQAAGAAAAECSSDKKDSR
jgi:flagellar biogenesis protein FliO